MVLLGHRHMDMKQVWKQVMHVYGEKGNETGINK